MRIFLHIAVLLLAPIAGFLFLSDLRRRGLHPRCATLFVVVAVIVWSLVTLASLFIHLTAV